MALIEIQNVSVSFPIYNINSRSFKKSFLRLATGGGVIQDAKNRMVVNALKDINLTLKNGDRIGVIGHNGAGKSTLLRLLAQIYEPNEGYMRIEGSISPMLNIMHGIEGEFTGFENIELRGTMLGLSKEEIKQNTSNIIEFSGLGDYMAMPIRTYSSGMMVRLAFAISTCMKPDILLIDEVFGAGDAEFMVKARQRMVTLLEESSIVLMASHSLPLIKEFCKDIMLLESGKIKAFGPTADVLKEYQRK